MTVKSKGGRESNDVRLGDALLGLPCLQRRRAQLTVGLQGGKRDEPVRCPVCGSEVAELVGDFGAAGAAVLEGVRERFPGWVPEDGLCGPCLEHFSQRLER